MLIKLMDWMLQIREEFVQSIFAEIKRYGDSCLLLCVFGITILSYFLIEREKLKRGRTLMCTYLVLCAIPLMQIITHTVFMFIKTDSSVDIGNSRLIFPVWLIMAYSATVLVLSIRKRMYRVYMTIGLCAVMVFAGSSMTSINMLTQAKNVYKVSEGVPELADEVLMINGGNPTRILVFQPYLGDEDWPAEENVYQGLCMYSSKLSVDCYAYSPSEDLTSNGFIEAVIPQKADAIDYFIFPENLENSRVMEEHGFSLVGNAGGYNIFRNGL